jgi:hypothetical protein
MPGCFCTTWWCRAAGNNVSSVSAYPVTEDSAHASAWCTPRPFGSSSWQSWLMARMSCSEWSRHSQRDVGDALVPLMHVRNNTKVFLTAIKMEAFSDMSDCPVTTTPASWFGCGDFRCVTNRVWWFCLAISTRPKQHYSCCKSRWADKDERIFVDHSQVCMSYKMLLRSTVQRCCPTMSRHCFCVLVVVVLFWVRSARNAPRVTPLFTILGRT